MQQHLSKCSEFLLSYIVTGWRPFLQLLSAVTYTAGLLVICTGVIAEKQEWFGWGFLALLAALTFSLVRFISQVKRKGAIP